MTDDASRDDLQLVESVRAGDERAFLQLLERYHPMLRRLASVYVGSGVAAEELVEETWLKVLKDIDRFDQRSTLRMWVCRLLRELACATCRELDLTWLGEEGPGRHGSKSAVDRRRFRADGYWQVPPRPFGDVLDRRSLGHDFVAHATAAAAALPLAEREVITLRDIEGWTAGEVCALLVISHAQQRALLQHGRSTVCAALEALVTEAELAGVPA
jgi:RNA polymerase sigma-70 factor (ECF subfamily)